MYMYIYNSHCPAKLCIPEHSCSGSRPAEAAGGGGGVLFGQHLSFTAHIRQLHGYSRLAASRLPPKASRVLDSRCRGGVIYKGFVRPVLEYGMLAGMSAAPTTVARFTAIQRRGLRLIGDGAYIPSLDIRRMVEALCFLYKLHFFWPRHASNPSSTPSDQHITP